jgi:hypothetical protein
MGFIGLLFVGAALVYSVRYFGYVHGQEFAADNFNRREFSFYQIPVVGWQITPIDRRDITNDLENYLANQKIISPLSTPAAKKRWDLILAQHGYMSNSRIVSQGEARILCEYLDAKDSKGDQIWLDWTKNNLSIAKVVWPAVAQVARQELYLFAPELLIRARNAKEPGEFQQQIDQLLAEKYLTFGMIQQQLNNHAAAVELFNSALVHAPAHAETLAARAKSSATLEKPSASPQRGDTSQPGV